jgi:hypothetical protein
MSFWAQRPGRALDKLLAAHLRKHCMVERQWCLMNERIVLLIVLVSYAVLIAIMYFHPANVMR